MESNNKIVKLSMCIDMHLKNIIDVSQFNKESLNNLFEKTHVLKREVLNLGKLNLLKGKVVCLYFDEPSTRTYSSFYVAIKKLGGDVLHLDNVNSSIKKGESLYDTLKCIESYCDLVIIRTKMKNALRGLQDMIKIPIINAGDGDGEHPTQALLDMFTINKELGNINQLIVSIVGDLKYGRTVHSLVRLLSNYNVKLNFVSINQLSLDNETIKFLKTNNIEYNLYQSIYNIIRTTDVLYMTRIQKERLQGETLDDSFIRNNLYLTKEVLNNAKKNMIVMHPLPRNDEINVNIDDDPRAVYFKQMENGLYVRMALIQTLLNLKN